MSTDIQETTAGNESIRFTGRVKWFNNKAGYVLLQSQTMVA